MLKGVVSGGDGRRVLLLGIDAENARRLKDGQPIKVNGSDLVDGGWPAECDVVIVYGETLQALVGELRAAGLEVPLD